MHDRALHDVLIRLTEEAAARLSDDVAHGAEVPFELVDAGRGGPALYCYRPLTARFLDDRFAELALLPGYPAAVRALEQRPGLGNYLRARGRTRIPGGARPRADLVLRDLLVALWDGTEAFAFDPQRFAVAYTDLERALFAGRSLSCVMVAIEGLELAAPEVTLSGGLALVRADALQHGPDELTVSGDATAVAVLRDDRPPDDDGGLDEAARALRRLQSALRLWDAAAPQLAPTAYARADGGPWTATTLTVGVRRAEGTVVLARDDEDPFRAFCALVGRRVPRGGALAWALRRFELGLERGSALEALTDWLLAAEALLGPTAGDPDEPGLLAERLAAICAPAGRERDALAARLDECGAVERAIIAGNLRPEPPVHALVEELGGCLRAILRDTLCGHLDPDLRAVADTQLAAGLPA